jgi:hypothetical protein
MYPVWGLYFKQSLDRRAWIAPFCGHLRVKTPATPHAGCVAQMPRANARVRCPGVLTLPLRGIPV